MNMMMSTTTTIVILSIITIHINILVATSAVIAVITNLFVLQVCIQ